MFFLMVPERLPYADRQYMTVRKGSYKSLQRAKGALKRAPKHSYILDANRRVVAHTETLAI